MDLLVRLMLCVEMYRRPRSSGVTTSADILWWLWLRHVSVDVAQEERCRKSLEHFRSESK